MGAGTCIIIYKISIFPHAFTKWYIQMSNFVWYIYIYKSKCICMYIYKMLKYMLLYRHTHIYIYIWLILRNFEQVSVI